MSLFSRRELQFGFSSKINYTFRLRFVQWKSRYSEIYIVKEHEEGSVSVGYGFSCLCHLCS